MVNNSAQNNDFRNRSKKILERLAALDGQEQRDPFPRLEQQKQIFFNERPWQIQNQEKLLFKQQEEKAKQQVELILAELQKIAQSSKKLVQEVKQTISQTPARPGVYHLNFLGKIKQALILLRKSIDQSATWLTVTRNRAGKRGHYWQQVQQSGTKYLQPQERYMSTQVG